MLSDLPKTSTSSSDRVGEGGWIVVPVRKDISGVKGMYAGGGVLPGIYGTISRKGCGAGWAKKRRK